MAPTLKEKFIQRARKVALLRQVLALSNTIRYSLRKNTFPGEVWIENTNCCNANCTMCPREKMTRKQGVMGMPLFEKIVRQIAPHAAHLTRLHLHNYGEPLLDKELPRKIKFAKEQGIALTYFVTNASLLTPGLSEALINAGLDEMKVSFYGTDPITYRNTMRGLDFEKTLENIRNFIKIRKESGKTTPRLFIQYLPQEKNQGKVDDFSKLMLPLLDKACGDALSLFDLHNFGGGKSYVPVGYIARTCEFPWTVMVILQDGSVVPCCFDYNGSIVLGNVHTDSIQNIWNSKAYAKLRRDFIAMRYQQYPVCHTCTFIHEQKKAG